MKEFDTWEFAHMVIGACEFVLQSEGNVSIYGEEGADARMRLSSTIMLMAKESGYVKRPKNELLDE